MLVSVGTNVEILREIHWRHWRHHPEYQDQAAKRPGPGFEKEFLQGAIPNYHDISSILYWLVVWNMTFIFPNTWDDDPI